MHGCYSCCTLRVSCASAAFSQQLTRKCPSPAVACIIIIIIKLPDQAIASTPSRAAACQYVWLLVDSWGLVVKGLTTGLTMVLTTGSTTVLTEGGNYHMMSVFMHDA
jgi:hypothetical protein